eukprot:TRINITY_DN13540_c2_g1_i1.p1 TRINITY_DN13540_c2_g1~~TRINITY_DN13540_c2_g1_i1.p1  ORF type:complete len:216 (+),score=28.03 TRINITY_DN13540_c2_g1_i1:31-678(+)
MKHKSKELISIDEIGPVEGHQHRSTCIMLHGYGDSVVLWYEVIQEMSLQMPQTRFVVPSAPFDDHGVHIWYIFDKETPYDGLDLVKPLIDAERSKCNNLAIIGFSQGGAVALASLFSSPPPVAVVSMSSFFKKPTKPSSASKQQQSTPILVVHGALDPVVRIKSARNATQKLKDCGFANVDLKTYNNLAHSVTPQSLSYVVKFLVRHLYDTNSKL